jgi:hypothetical protein
MNLRKLIQKYLRWCPGVEAVSRLIPDAEIGANKIILVLADLGLFAAIFSGLPGDFRFLLMLVSLIAIPYTWITLRGKKYGDQEGTYPDPSIPLPDWRSDDYLKQGWPGAEASVFGPIRLHWSYMSFQELKHAWTHRDVTYFQGFVKRQNEAE